MAIDTEDKRRSAISVSPGIRILPIADGAIAQSDWQAVGKVYRGIAAFAGFNIAVLAYHYYRRRNRK